MMNFDKKIKNQKIYLNRMDYYFKIFKINFKKKMKYNKNILNFFMSNNKGNYQKMNLNK